MDNEVFWRWGATVIDANWVFEWLLTHLDDAWFQRGTTQGDLTPIYLVDYGPG